VQEYTCESSINKYYDNARNPQKDIPQP